MSLLGRVVRQLVTSDIPYAAIGATALMHYGVGRATRDVDLLCVEDRALDPSTWDPLAARGVEIEIRRGDADDPLAGVVRCREGTERPVDVIVGARGWQRAVIERSRPGRVAEVEVPVVRAVDLILLKLYAGGPQDAWDIEELLAGEDREEHCRGVEEELTVLPESARELWRRIRSRPSPED